MAPRPKIRHCLAAGLLAGLLALPCAAEAIKLYLKDGSYQMVSSYEVQGDRVRYFSVERSEWEEIPTTLVDFDATRRAQDEAKAAEKKQLEQARQNDQERFYKSPDTGLEVAPGLRLPGDDGIFTVDGKRLVRLAQSEAESITDKKRAAMVLAVPLPIVKARSMIVLDGPKAVIRLNDPQPVFYVQSAAGLGANLQLVKLKTEKQARVVEEVETARGKNAASSEERSIVQVERRRVAPNVYSLRPLQPLEGGEYALGEVADDKLSMDVWDFGYEKWEVIKESSPAK